MVNQSQTKIKEYIEIVEKVAKVEHRRIPSHMVDYEELVSIGIIAVQALIKNKTPEQLEKYNSSYIGTAVRWAIRNELRNRYNGTRSNTQKTIPLKRAILRAILMFLREKSERLFTKQSFLSTQLPLQARITILRSILSKTRMHFPMKKPKSASLEKQ